MTLPARVALVEVGPRDGLQNEAAQITTADKIAFVDRLSQAGYTVIEVNGTPRWEGILQATGDDMAEHIVAHAADLATRRRPRRIDRAASP